MKIYLAAAIAAATLIAPVAANAQAYVQAQVGLDAVDVDGYSDEGVAFGVAAGYQAPIGGNLFAGIEAGIDDSTTKYCETYGEARECLKSGRDLSVVARVGTNLTPTGQLYVLGGYTNARLKATYRDADFSDSDGVNLDGFRLGAGFRHTFSTNMFAKIEYRYSDYEYDVSRHNAILAVGMNF